MSVFGATNTVGSVPKRIVNRTTHTTLGAFIIMSICRTCLANIFCWIPSQWGSANQTYFTCWIEVASLGTNAYISCIIENQSFSTCYTCFVFLVPVSWLIACHTTSVCKHKRRFNRTDADILESIVHLASWTCHTFFSRYVPILS